WQVTSNAVTRPLRVSEPPSITRSVQGWPGVGGRKPVAAPCGTGMRNVHDWLPVTLVPFTQSDDTAPAVPGSVNTGPPSPSNPARTADSTSLSSASWTSVASIVATLGPSGLVHATAGLARRTPDSVYPTRYQKRAP